MGAALKECIPRNIAAEKYREAHAKRTLQELRTLAEIKRFIERRIADPRFREALAQSADESRRAAESYGIGVDPRQLLPLFEPGLAHIRFSKESGSWPLVKLWDDYVSDSLKCLEIFERAGDCAAVNPRFHAWRQRQIHRCKSELDSASARAITHPILAFEVSTGCSIGCWFCGVSASKLGGNFLYTDENARLWRAILEQAVELFGSAAQTGFCYCATEPSDNLDYPKFIEDYYFVTGSLPQTTTAAPLRNHAFTRRVLELASRYGCTNTRFSILSLGILNRVHKEFTARELLNVELVLQNRESLAIKAVAGRARERFEKPAGRATNQEAQTTIACVTGFLVNMVTRTIQLITPTRASERWPLGYRVYGERRFESVAEFRAAIEDLIATHMGDEVEAESVLAFRSDLCYQRDGQGFTLKNAHRSFALNGFAGAAELGDLIHEGHRTAGQIQAALVDHGADVLAVAGALQKLFEAGVLNDDPLCCGVASEASLAAAIG